MSYKSLTINERYNILKEFGKIEKENTDALIQWRNDMSLLSQKQFQKMLQYNQYDKKIFSYAVTREPDENIVKLYEKSEVEHIWRCTYWEILNTNILYEEKSYWGQDEGFNYIVRHFVKYVEKQLIESLEGIKFTKDCLDGILRQFTLKLVDLGNKAMIMELNHLKESQNLKGDTSAERFKYFISLFENMEFLKSFYEKYSVLARLYTELSILFINNIKEIWDFIKNDKEILKEEFGIVDGEFVLNKVAIGIGDTHNFGKTVTILEFANNKKLVYKPRNLKINEAYNNLIDFLNKTGKIHVLKKLKSLSFEDHGYEEFLDHCLCETEYELQNFYIRFGEILALSYILNATDLHMENLIAYGEYPVIIDLETFIQQPNSFNDDVLNEKINYEFDSVKRTLLLESRLRQNDVNEGIDISAINGKGYVMDEVLVPINMYTDMVRYEKQRVQIKGAKNLPFSEKYSRNVKKYINEILTGFSYVYDAFLELKDDSCFRDVIKKFSGVQVRHIIRNTDQYDTILRHSMHPEHLMDMLDREKILENMWSSSAYDDFVVFSEVNGMQRNDIPIFYKYTDGNSIFNDMNQEKDGYFSQDAYSRLIKNIENLSVKNKEKQKSFIHLALDYQDLILDGKCDSSKLTFKEIDMKNEYYIFSYLKKVKDYAIKIADEKAWYAPILNNFGKWSYDLVDNDLYDGMGGPALIAHYYGKDEELQENIISIMESRCNDEMVDFYIKQKNVGLAASFGIFHVVSFMKKEYINCPRIAKIIELFHSVLERMIDKEMECDYINGTLSVVATLLRLYEKNGEIKNKQLAISYIEKTIENKESFDGYGMAHGLMGLTLMLYKVWKVTGIKKYLFLGESLLNKIKENIHDVESMSWCRGNVGLALGLLKIQNIIAADRENDMIQEMVDEIHTKICNSNKMKNDCICHGNLSVAEYFIFRYQIFKDEKDLKIATKIVNMVKDRQTFRSLPEIPGFGIFTGEGGLAYELLRLEKCEEVPTLLC